MVSSGLLKYGARVRVGPRGFAEYVRKVHGKADLPADARAAHILTAEDAEVHGHAVPKLVLCSQHELKLTPSEAASRIISPVNFGSQRQASGEIVQNGQAAGIDVAPARLHSQHAGARVACEQVSQVE